MTPSLALAAGWSIIPAGRNKKPLLPTWIPFQSRRPTEAQVSEWKRRLSPATWALITGAISGRITLDFDGERGRQTLRKLGLEGIEPHRSTPSGGLHMDFVHPGWRVKTLNAKADRELGRRWPGLDIRADGGYVCFLGWTDRGEYRWLRDPAPYQLDILPTDLREYLGLLRAPRAASPQPQTNGKIPAVSSNGRVDAERLIRQALEISSSGGRNNAGFWLAAQLRDNGHSSGEAAAAMRNYRSRCPNVNTKGEPESYTEQEVQATLREAYSRPAREPWGRRQSEERAKEAPASYGVYGVEPAPAEGAGGAEAPQKTNQKPERGQTGDACFNLTSLQNLLNEPEEKVTWILDGILPAGGLSQLNGKPKAGKSTFARCLALAVAQGEPFLNRATERGPVLYLAFEEKRGEVRKHFKALGVTGDEPLFVHIERAPANALLAAHRAIEQHDPALVIIDTLLKFVRVRDANDYAQVTAALEPILDLARKSGAHLLLVHHAGKSDKPDPVDSAVGSTGFGAGVDTVLVLKRTDRYRTLQSVQRYGEDLPETVLDFDTERKAVLLGPEKSAADVARAGEGILEYLKAIGSQTTEAEIAEAVECRTKAQKRALRELCEAGKVLRAGAGKKGDPFVYSLAPGFSFPGSHYIPGTREPETENPVHPAETKTGKPASDAREPESDFGESREPESRAQPDVEIEL
jgi:hypothetical protein